MIWIRKVTQNCPSNVFSQECGCCRTEKSLVCSDHLVFICIGRINEEKMAAVKVYEEPGLRGRNCTSWLQPLLSDADMSALSDMAFTIQIHSRKPLVPYPSFLHCRLYISCVIAAFIIVHDCFADPAGAGTGHQPHRNRSTSCRISITLHTTTYFTLIWSSSSFRVWIGRAKSYSNIAHRFGLIGIWKTSAGQPGSYQDTTLHCTAASHQTQPQEYIHPPINLMASNAVAILLPNFCFPSQSFTIFIF